MSFTGFTKAGDLPARRMRTLDGVLYEEILPNRHGHIMLSAGVPIVQIDNVWYQRAPVQTNQERHMVNCTCCGTPCASSAAALCATCARTAVRLADVSWTDFKCARCAGPCFYSETAGCRKCSPERYAPPVDAVQMETGRPKPGQWDWFCRHFTGMAPLTTNEQFDRASDLLCSERKAHAEAKAEAEKLKRERDEAERDRDRVTDFLSDRFGITVQPQVDGYLTSLPAGLEKLDHSVQTMRADQKRYLRLFDLVVELHGQHADDRCWMNTDALFKEVGLSVPDRTVGDKMAMLENCKRFIDRQCEGGTWRTYAELEAELIQQRHRVLDAVRTALNQPPPKGGV